MQSSLAQKSEVQGVKGRSIPAIGDRLRWTGKMEIPAIDDFRPHIKLVSKMGIHLESPDLKEAFLRPSHRCESAPSIVCEQHGFRGSVIEPREFVPLLEERRLLKVAHLHHYLMNLTPPLAYLGACLIHGRGKEVFLVAIRPLHLGGWEIKVLTREELWQPFAAYRWQIIRPAAARSVS